MFKKITLLGLALALTATLLFARGKNNNREDFRGKRNTEFCEENFQERKGERLKRLLPDLTDEQLEKIETMKLDQRAEMVAFRSDMKIKRLEMKKLVSQNSDKDDIDSKIDEITTLENKIMKKRIDHHFKIRNILTEKQQKVWDLHFQSRRDFGKRGHRKSNGHGFGGCK